MNWDYMTSGWMWRPMALLLALLALAVVALNRATTRRTPNGARAPLAIASRRYGELTNDRHGEIRSALAWALR